MSLTTPSTSIVDLDQTIPNNVGLADDAKLLRALEKWRPAFLSWWQDMGPEGFQADDVYLRTAISVESGGWANFGYVKMPDYRWGVFLEPAEQDRKIGFGDHMGAPVWQDVPGEYRNMLRRLIVTQGDTEPASVEQQRLLGQTSPSQYDLRNLFQVNVEEGRHLWAMVYLLHRYFGRDGREEADALLERRSGNADRPRILGAFNEPITDWLSFFMFTTFTDRDGKYQLLALAESGFDPLARTTRFMLTEEAHHMFVGETGVERMVRRAAELQKADPNGDARAHGGIDLATLQRYLNFWFSTSLDLFGGEISSNAASYFASGVKGRAKEQRYEDHKALDGTFSMEVVENGPSGSKMAKREVPLRTAMNEVLREAYIADCQKAVDRWNRTLEKAGLSERLRLPDHKFHRRVGEYSGHAFDPEGHLISDAAWTHGRDAWMPSASDQAYVSSLMGPAIFEPGKMAQWIAPPLQGIDAKPSDFEYVRHAR